MHVTTISLFHTILSFCSMLAWDFSCAMLAKCWHSICSNQICLDNIAQDLFSSMLSAACQTTLHRVLTWGNNEQSFSCVMLSWAWRTTLHRVFTCARFTPGVLRHHCRRFFSCAMLSKYIWDNIAWENYLYNVNLERKDIDLQKNNLSNVVLNLPGPTLYKAFTWAM